MSAQPQNAVLSLYCRPLHSTTKHVVHCRLMCDYKNRCKDFVAHYIKNQETIDEATARFQSLRDKESKAAMLDNIIEQPNPDTITPPAQPKAKPGSRLPLIETTTSQTQKKEKRIESSPKLKSSIAPAIQTDKKSQKPAIQEKQTSGKSTGAKIELKTAPSHAIAQRKEQHSLVETFIVLESGGKALVFDDERKVLDHVIKSKRKSRYFRATELEVQLQMVPVINKPKPKKAVSRKKVEV